jgi:histone deacetylase 1/2
VHTANFLRNRSPSANLSVTPFEAFYGTQPDVSMLRVFGCPAWVHVPAGFRQKLDPKCKKGVFVGYEPDCKTYRVWVGEGRIMQSTNVVFDECPFVQHEKRGPAIAADLLEPVKLFVPPAIEADDAANNAVGLLQALGGADLDLHDSASSDGGNDAAGAGAAGAAALDGTDSSGSDAGDVPGVPAVPDAPGGAAEAAPGAVPGVRRSGRSNLGKPPPEFWRVNAVSADVSKLSGDPLTYEEAMGRPDADLWRQACDEEIKSLHENGTYVLEPVPAGVKPLKCKWVFKIKRDAAGKVERYKARLVAKGCQQIPGVDFSDVYAPVSKHTTLRALLSFAAEHKWPVDHIDVKTAFLNGDLEEELYMVQPPGYESGGPGVACKLQKALYGLRQAPRAWYNKLSAVLEQLGFVCCDADPGLWVYKSSAGAVYLLAYVDDLLVTGDGDCGGVKQKLMSKFAARDLGPVSMFLGMEVLRDVEGRLLKLCQHKYVRELLEKYNMQNSASVRTPLAAGTKLSREGEGAGDDLEPGVPFSELVGALLYLSVCTRPDIAHAVGLLARFMSAPKKQHWVAAKRVLRYLKGTPDLGICFWAREYMPSVVEAYVDADFAGCHSTRKCTTGFVFTLNCGAISWSSKRQSVVYY